MWFVKMTLATVFLIMVNLAHSIAWFCSNSSLCPAWSWHDFSTLMVRMSFQWFNNPFWLKMLPPSYSPDFKVYVMTSYFESRQFFLGNEQGFGTAQQSNTSGCRLVVNYLLFFSHVLFLKMTIIFKNQHQIAKP